MLVSWIFSVLCGITATLVRLFWAVLQCYARICEPYTRLSAQCGVNVLNTCERNTMAPSNLISSVLYVTRQRMDPN